MITEIHRLRGIESLVLPDWCEHIDISRVSGYGFWSIDLYSRALANDDGKVWELVDDERPLCYRLGACIEEIPGVDGFDEFSAYRSPDGWTVIAEDPEFETIDPDLMSAIRDAVKGKDTP